MKLDLSKFKKVKEDKKGAVLKHPAGHHITIAKNALKPEMQEQLSKLPLHMDVGGQVPSMEEEPKPQATQPTIIINNTPQPQQQAPQAPNYMTNGTFDFNKYVQSSEDAPIESKIDVMKQQKAQEQMAAQSAEAAGSAERNKVLEYNALAAERGMPLMQVPGGSPSVPAPQAPGMVPSGAAQNTMNDPNANLGAKEEAMRSVEGLQPAMPAPSGTPAFTMAENDPYGYKSYAQNTMEGVQGQMQGIQQQADAEAARGKAKAQVLQQGIQQQQMIMADAQKNFADIGKESDAVLNDLKAQHIDPNHFLHSMGAGQKIRTAIGLILGGMGGGLMHQENPALKFLNDQIERDVKGQQMNLNKSSQLFQAYQQKFGNAKDAATMYSIVQRNIMADQIEQEAQKAEDPLAQARAMQAANALKVQNAGMAKQFAMGLAMSGGQNAQGPAAPQNPALMIRMVVPEGQQKAAFDELKEAQTMTRFKDNTMSAFDKVEKLATVSNNLMSPLQTGRQIDAILDPIITSLSKETAGRFTEADSKFLRSLFPRAGDSAETSAAKRHQLNALISEKMNFPMLQSYGINMGMPQQASRFDASGEKKLQLGAPVLGNK